MGLAANMSIAWSRRWFTASFGLISGGWNVAHRYMRDIAPGPWISTSMIATVPRP